MGYYCTVPQCTSLAGKTKNVKFHRFPRDESMADSWNIILKRGKPYTKYSKVCSLHFTPGDYNVTSMGKNAGQWKTLNKDAIPSQNLPRVNPDGTVMVIRKSRSPKHRSDTTVVKSSTLNLSMDSVYTPNKSDWGVKSSSPDMSGIDYRDELKSSQTPSTSITNLQKQSRDSLESLNSESPLPLDNKSVVSKRDASFLNDKSIGGKRNSSFLNDSSSFNYHRPHEDENDGIRSTKGSPENYKIAKLNLKEENNESSHSSSIYSNSQSEFDTVNLLQSNEQQNMSDRPTNSEQPNFYTQRIKEEVEIEIDLMNRNNEQNTQTVDQNQQKGDQNGQNVEHLRRSLENNDMFPQGLEQTIMLQQKREIFERLRREEQLMKGEFFMRNRIKDEPDSGMQDSQGSSDQNSTLPMASMYFNSDNVSVPSYYKQRDNSEITQEDLKQQKEEQIRQIQKKLREDALRQRQEREEQLKKWQQDDILRQQRQQEEALSQRQQQQDLLRQQEEALRQRQEDILRQQRIQEALQRQQEENMRQRQEEVLRLQREDLLRQQEDALTQREQQGLLRQQEETLRQRQEDVLRQQQEDALIQQEDILRQRQQQEDMLLLQQDEILRQQENMLRQRQEEELMQQQQEEVLRQQEDMLRQQQEDMLNQQQIFRQRAEEMLKEDILRQHEENLRQRHAQQQDLLRKQDDLIRLTQEELLRDRQQRQEDSLSQQEDMLRQQEDMLRQQEVLGQDEQEEALRQQDEALRQQDEALRQQEDLLRQRQEEENMMQEQMLQQHMSHQQLGPEQLIAKQNALAAHTGLWQNSVKRPFFYSEAQQFNTAQLFQNRYEDIARLLNQ